MFTIIVFYTYAIVKFKIKCRGIKVIVIYLKI